MQIRISDIKAGDKIQLKQGNVRYVVSLVAEECIYAATMDNSYTICVAINDIGKVYSTGIQETAKESQQQKQRKHKDLIIAWANGAEIQHFSKLYDCWRDCINPAWAPEQEYRIKPTKPANNIKRMYVEYKPCLDNARNKPNLELEFDAESGELVKANVLE